MRPHALETAARTGSTHRRPHPEPRRRLRNHCCGNGNCYIGSKEHYSYSTRRSRGGRIAAATTVVIAMATVLLLSMARVSSAAVFNVGGRAGLVGRAGFLGAPAVSCSARSWSSGGSRPRASADGQGLPDLPPLEANGFLAVYKPEDWTSNDVVQKIRGVLEKEARRRAGRKVSIKVGHGGTLDPMATGVLVIGVGTACRDLGVFLKGSKGYRAVALLGSEYDTMDRTGQVTETVDIAGVTPEALEAALPQFRGEIMQKPPAFSAIKKGGKRLYELARQGEQVEVEARPVQVDRLELVMEDDDGNPLEWPHFGLDIECGGGTYVRSLISDLARAAGSRAHMTALRRTKQGPFKLKHCLEEAKWRTDAEAIVAHLVRPGGGGGGGGKQ